MFDKKANTVHKINELLANRWSGRAYDPDRSITQEVLETLLEAAQWSPSCFGDQPWRYIVFDKKLDQDNWKNAYDCLSPGNQSWAVNAPILMLANADTILTKADKPNRWGAYDTGAASMGLCVQATDMGLMVHQMGGFDAEKARTLFSIPDRYIPMAMITIGYQLEKARIPEDMIERETAARTRNPLNLNFFRGVWEKPFN